MSLFPRFTQEFSPLFRLLDDYDRASRDAMRHVDSNLKSFSPKFDVKETKDAYELHGEFPGIEQKDINIEWTDANTLSVSGRTEASYEEGERPRGFIEEGDVGDKHKHQPTVEDEDAGRSSKAVSKKGNQEVAKQNEHETKYWVSERSVGEFHRSFAFPARINQDAVKANLKNGILSIIVPKAQAPKAKKINIE
ncbi:HSP20-like chaperone [Delitschia confertaspora ATCC 74209]|uniref:HSP20-like chaperone n=1 Tax=Delitschia confertaspora ATCC 74209 TaxID=1513339 RepID=A0A9P4JVV5_9PLEO|nr:HSP20-like chaperone [Delitschia confertaspora ATCC 74209]